ncbi:hypothetical protein B879_04222 [Cecembia lonarensis LW9]|uniref:Uncharacterized protein n=1 Tax=Cecembia lonarensis (strain CCUG 58316 / KCTC 22772 / LW9) TaxID=1225176 RepID=K1KSP3_CECL9|nr:hypothetical protein B879_04222 [Cecembia lonarensis LW9]
MRLSAGERGGGLTQSDVAQSYIHQRAQVAGDRGERGKEFRALLDGHVQHIGDGFAFVLDLQGLAVVPRTMANLTRNVDVGQEVHFDLQRAVARAGFAAPALDVEGETSRQVAPDLGFVGLCEELAHVVEDPSVGRWVGARGAANGRLVHVDDLVQVFEPLDARVASGDLLGTVESVGQHLVEHVVD